MNSGNFYSLGPIDDDDDDDYYKSVHLRHSHLSMTITWMISVAFDNSMGALINVHSALDRRSPRDVSSSPLCLSCKLSSHFTHVEFIRHDVNANDHIQLTSRCHFALPLSKPPQSSRRPRAYQPTSHPPTDRRSDQTATGRWVSVTWFPFIHKTWNMCGQETTPNIWIPQQQHD